MPTLYNQSWSKDDLRKHTGTLRQIAGVTRYELQEGHEKGVEILDVRTGSGFRFHVCPSRGFDITFAEHNGRPLCWNSTTGVHHPAYYTETNLGWLRGFYGGLMTTCGLLSFGRDSSDDNEYFGLHDRASYTPATDVKVFEEWVGDEYEIAVEGTVRQTRVFGSNLKLVRRISTKLGADTLKVQDRVVNDNYESSPLVILYHCNFGFPVVSEHSVIKAPSMAQQPFDDFAAQSKETWMQLEAPQPGLAERCYFHTMTPGAGGQVRAEIWNSQIEFGAFIQYDATALPYFTQWKMMGARNYVNGLEPSNAPLASRAELREKNALPHIEPGEEKIFSLELGVV